MIRFLLLCVVFIPFRGNGQGDNSLQLYEKAFLSLDSMLNNTLPLSFKEAVYIVENAYLEGKLNKKIWEKGINDLVKLSKAVKNSNDFQYSGSDFERIKTYGAVYRVMMDTLTIISGAQNQSFHFPFTYDFDDIWGKEDWTKQFVSKLLISKKGNCHSLPILYKIIVDEFEEPCYLSVAPNHLYIKLKSEEYGMFNTELTSNSFPNDGWIFASGYCHLDAIRNGIYMDTLTDKMSVALCMFDLAKGYEKKFGFDEQFLQKCCDQALLHYPKYVNALLLQVEIKRRSYFNLMAQYGVQYPKELFKLVEGAKNQFDEIEQLYINLHQLGYRQMPESAYIEFLLDLQKNKANYQNEQLNSLRK